MGFKGAGILLHDMIIRDLLPSGKRYHWGAHVFRAKYRHVLIPTNCATMGRFFYVMAGHQSDGSYTCGVYKLPLFGRIAIESVRLFVRISLESATISRRV